MMMPKLNHADQQALNRLMDVEPIWIELGTTHELIGLDDYTLLHAGPPIHPRDAIAPPLYHSAILAILFETWATTVEQAAHLIASGRIQLRPAQDWSVVTPLASVVSPSMVLQVIGDRHHPHHRAYSPLNGGPSPALRFGTLDLTIVERLRWLHDRLAPALKTVLHTPIDLIPIADYALASGNECHGMTAAGTELLCNMLQPMNLDTDALKFIQVSPTFFLNLWMGACKCMLNAASGIEGSSLITGMAGNGREFGITLSANPGRWITAPALPPQHHSNDSMFPEQYCGAIGDSAVIDTLGLGGMALSYAPQLATALQAIAPSDFDQLPQYLLATAHPGFVASHLRVGLTAAAVRDMRMTPLINLAMLDQQGISGMVGKGIYRPPLTLFERAIAEIVA
ncbi:MAG: DUF1116 domain-containing protein [Elainellaceae cyanobacterium]